jgi:hypothetical protein
VVLGREDLVAMSQIEACIYISSSTTLERTKSMFPGRKRAKLPHKTCTPIKVLTKGLAHEKTQWEYIDGGHAVIVAFAAGVGKKLVGRWNLGEEAFEWQHELNISTLCKPAVSSDGSRVAVCGNREFGCGNREFDASHVYCAVSGCLLGYFQLTCCCKFSQVRFSPNHEDSVVFSWEKVSTTGYYNTEKTFLSLHNFVTGECTWESEMDCYAVAVHNPMLTVLM